MISDKLTTPLPAQLPYVLLVISGVLATGIAVAMVGARVLALEHGATTLGVVIDDVVIREAWRLPLLIGAVGMFLCLASGAKIRQLRRRDTT